MKKPELASSIADKIPHLSAKTVAKAVNLIIDAMIDALVAGKRVELRGFASFSIREIKPRLARNPATGECIPTLAKSKVHFKAGRELRERVQASRHFVALAKTNNKDEAPCKVSEVS